MSQLQKIVLQPADLPTTWKGTPHQADSSDAANAAGEAALVKCVGARNTASDKAAEADSQDFVLGDASISSSASSYRSQSDVDADVIMLASPKLSACYEQVIKGLFAKSLPAGAKFEPTVKIIPGSPGGPTNVPATVTATIKVKANGQQSAAYITAAYITGPLIEAEVDAANIGTPVPAALVQSLVATVANRAAKG